MDVYLVELTDARASVGHEGIRGLLWFTEEELWTKTAAGEITDGITLSALALLRGQSK